MPAIRIDRPPGTTLRGLWRKSLAGLIADLKDAPQAGGVHGVRKRLKFLRSQLHLLRFAIGDRAFGAANAQLREAADAFAGARRAAALQEAIGKLREHRETPAPALDELSALVRQAHAQDMADAALAAAAQRALALLGALQRSSARWRLAKREPDLYLKAMREVFGEARRTLAAGLAAEDMATLHEARKWVIRHLHHLETLHGLWPDLMRVWTGELARLREALGDLNDLDELDGLMAAEPAFFSSAGRRQEAAAAIGERRRALVARVRDRFHHLFAETPKAFAARIGAMWRAEMD